MLANIGFYLFATAIVGFIIYVIAAAVWPFGIVKKRWQALAPLLFLPWWVFALSSVPRDLQPYHSGGSTYEPPTRRDPLPEAPSTLSPPKLDPYKPKTERPFVD